MLVAGPAYDMLPPVIPCLQEPPLWPCLVLHGWDRGHSWALEACLLQATSSVLPQALFLALSNVPFEGRPKIQDSRRPGAIKVPFTMLGINQKMLDGLTCRGWLCCVCCDWGVQVQGSMDFLICPSSSVSIISLSGDNLNVGGGGGGGRGFTAYAYHFMYFALKYLEKHL